MGSIGGTGSNTPSVWNNPQILGAMLPNVNLSALQQAMQAQLLEDEQPLANMSTQLSTLQQQLSAWQTVSTDLGQIQSAVQQLGGATLYQGISATSSNTSTVAAQTVAGATGSPGSYQIRVNNLMQPEIDNSNPQTGSQTALGLQGSIGINGQTIKVTSADTLAQLAQNINAADAGVTATVLPTTVSGATQYVLNIASTAGKAITWSDPNGILGGLGIELGGKPTNQVQAAKAASFTINGVQETSSTNTVSSSIPGVTLQLVSPSTNTVQVTVSQNRSAITAAAGQLATAYNGLLAALNKYSGQGGVLEGNAGLLGLSGTLQQALTATNPTQPNGYQALAQIGVTLTAPVGAPDQLQLNVSSAKFGQALQDNPQAVASLFSATNGGIASLLNTDLTSYIGGTGSVTSTISSLKSQIQTLSNQVNNPQSAINQQITQQQTILQNQFQQMLQAMLSAQTQSQQISDFVNAQFGSSSSSQGSSSQGG
jgi:flagellar hook-associated protein 2